MRAADWLKYRGRRWYWQHWRRAEPRRYYRLYDLNTPCWQAVRAAAEASRSSAYEWLDRATFDDLLPPPNVKIEYRDPFAEGAARRTLLGLLLWDAPPGKVHATGRPDSICMAVASLGPSGSLTTTRRTR